MEKRRPAYDLEAVRLRVGRDAGYDVVDPVRCCCLGFDRAGVSRPLLGSNAACFNTSMTTFVDQRLWQDAYRRGKSLQRSQCAF